MNDFSSPDIPRSNQGNEVERRPMSEKMDQWYLGWKKNLMNDFQKLRLEFLEEAQQNILQEKQVQVKVYIRLNEEIKIMREMFNQYEQTIDEKHQMEKNLNKALDFLFNKTIADRRRVVRVEEQCEEFSLSLAKRFYEMKIKRKVLINWKDSIQQNWKERMEFVYERRSKVIVNEYKFKCKQLELQLVNANEEIARLRNEHGESVKQTFMRGICAFNMEAMTVLFKDSSEQHRQPIYPNPINRNRDRHSLHMDYHLKK